MGITVFTWRSVMEEKTNKHMSSVSFIGGQPVISASAVVSPETLSSNLSVFIYNMSVWSLRRGNVQPPDQPWLPLFGRCVFVCARL